MSNLKELLAAKKSENKVLAAEQEAELLAAITDYNGPKYQRIHLNRIIRKDGSSMYPVGDIFIPDTEEEYEHCEYFATQGLLKRIEPEQAAE